MISLAIEESGPQIKGCTYIGISEEKRKEIDNIAHQYLAYSSGQGGKYVVSAQRLVDRLDVKYCLGERGRKRAAWVAKGYEVIPIGRALSPAIGRQVKVNPMEAYQFLRVNYDGEVIEGDLMEGDQCSYTTLFSVRAWDVLLSNINVGRGAIALVPPYHAEKYVSNEYTILTANTTFEAVYYCNLVRTKEILGDILSITTGMGRGRIKWSDIAVCEVPAYKAGNRAIEQIVQDLEELWAAHSKFRTGQQAHITQVIDDLEVDGRDAHQRWLAFKPPE